MICLSFSKIDLRFFFEMSKKSLGYFLGTLWTVLTRISSYIFKIDDTFLPVDHAGEWESHLLSVVVIHWHVHPWYRWLQFDVLEVDRVLQNPLWTSTRLALVDGQTEVDVSKLTRRLAALKPWWSSLVTNSILFFFTINGHRFVKKRVSYKHTTSAPFI